MTLSIGPKYLDLIKDVEWTPMIETLNSFLTQILIFRSRFGDLDFLKFKKKIGQLLKHQHTNIRYWGTVSKRNFKFCAPYFYSIEFLWEWTYLKDDRLVFYRHTGVDSYKIDLCERILKKRGRCNTKSFGTTFFSSNNLDFFSTKNGYVICENGSGYNLIKSKVSLSTSQILTVRALILKV